MKKRIILSTLFASFLLLSLIASASAITGRLGNSRMVLRAEVGEEVQRSLLVENVNDIPLTIEFAASGDLASNVEFEETSFILPPGEEKKAFFTIKSDEAGTTETKINVLFKPEEGSGVGLTATVTLIAGGETDDEEPDQTLDDEEPDSIFNPGSNVEEPGQDTSLSPVLILTISTIALIAVFLILIIYSNKRKKRSGRPRG